MATTLPETIATHNCASAILRDMLPFADHTTTGTMARLWQPLLLPLLEATDARTIVEIGSDHGHLTAELIAYCETKDCTVHVIDPAPQYQSTDLPSCFHLHKDLSLNVLSKIGTCDAVFIDGDHNWYTVLHELILLEEIHSGQDLPLILLHDTDWPYGRRDMYHQPETIPEAERQPSARLGMLPEQAELVQGGFQNQTIHAQKEGGKKNGVLTAVEDFLASSKHRLVFLSLPGIHGTGILTSAARLERCPKLAALLHDLQPTPPLLRHMQGIEADRIRLSIAWQDMHRLIQELREENARLALKNTFAQQALDDERRRAAVRIAELEHYQHIAHRMLQSKSWRITSPLRTMGSFIQNLLRDSKL